MLSEMPLTRFHETIKFMRPSFLNDIGSNVMNRAFPGFVAKDTGISEHTREKLTGGLRTGKVDRQFILNQLRRRFSGGTSLPRGSYYSVCNDELGNDKGTLSRELSAYIEPEDFDHVVVHDLVMPEHGELLQEHCQAPAGLTVILEPVEGGTNPIIDELVEGELIPELAPGQGFVVYLPFDVQPLDVPDVFDLRFLETQQWLAHFLPKGNELFSLPHASAINEFPEMLPDLMIPDRGGSDLDKGIALFLRKSGVQGLVFPSARSDVLCEFTDGQLSDFRGWNFVDYRQTTEQWDQHNMIYQDDWLPHFGTAIVHGAPDDHPNAGSWRVEGHEAQLRSEMSKRPSDSLETIVILKNLTD